MANSPFLKLPIAISGAGLGTIASADQKPMFPPSPETDALGHWDFGGSALSLVDVINGRSLVPNAAAPIYDALGIKLPDGGLNGLVSDIADKANDYTIAMVVQPQAFMSVQGQQGLLAGTSQVSPSTGDGLGELMWMTGSTTPGNTTVSWNARNAGTGQNVNRTINGMTLGTTWLFALWSFGADGNRFTYIPGTVIVTGGPHVKTPSPTRKLALGNAYYNDPSYMYGLKFSEFIVWNRALSQAEGAAVFGRSIQRMKYRKGITLFGAA